MIDPLGKTKMTDFVIKNGYEWAFLYFRALVFSDTYANEEQVELEDDDSIHGQLQFVRNYWGSITDYISEIDYDTLAELFEYWCNDEAAKLALPVFDQIAVNSNNTITNLTPNTIYLITDESHNIAAINETYKEHLNSAMAKVNETLQRKVLFSEFQQGGDKTKIYRYERWLDAALLADMLTYVDQENYDRLELFIDLMNTDKECWNNFRNVYRDEGYLHIMKLRESTKDQPFDPYDKSNYDKKELKPAFDLIHTYVNQGRGLIQNVAKGKLSGVR